tara:strand:- start:624 stop:1115 length:492 start_codon:yes stop_codon:yes gene_type:complete
MPPDNPKIPDAHDGLSENRKLSATPEFTKSNVSVLCGFASTRIFEGYSFRSVTGVMLSTVAGENLFKEPLVGIGSSERKTLSPSGDLTDYNVLGYELSKSTTIPQPVGTWKINSDTRISIAIPELTAMCYLGIVVFNAAGFGTTVLSVSSDTRPNQLYVRYYE